jgi:hypothetical protein
MLSIESELANPEIVTKKSGKPNGECSPREVDESGRNAVGMDVFHRENIVHQDLRPEHILLDDDWEPKLPTSAL